MLIRWYIETRNATGRILTQDGLVINTAPYFRFLMNLTTEDVASRVVKMEALPDDGKEVVK